MKVWRRTTQHGYQNELEKKTIFMATDALSLYHLWMWTMQDILKCFLLLVNENTGGILTASQIRKRWTFRVVWCLVSAQHFGISCPLPTVLREASEPSLRWTGGILVLAVHPRELAPRGQPCKTDAAEQRENRHLNDAPASLRTQGEGLTGFLQLVSQVSQRLFPTPGHSGCTNKLGNVNRQKAQELPFPAPPPPLPQFL